MIPPASCSSVLRLTASTGVYLGLGLHDFRDLCAERSHSYVSVFITDTQGFEGSSFTRVMWHPRAGGRGAAGARSSSPCTTSTAATCRWGRRCGWSTWCRPGCFTRSIPRPSDRLWGVFYGDAHILVKHNVFDRYVHQNTGLPTQLTG